MKNIDYSKNRNEIIEQLFISGQDYNDIESQKVVDDIIYWKRNDIPVDVIMAVEWLNICHQIEVFSNKW